MDFLRAHQLSIMLFESGMCAMLALLTLVIRTISKKRRMILASMELGAMVLLLSDRFAYLYRGDTSTTGYWMVRVSNFLVFYMTLFLLHSFTLYLADIYKSDEIRKKVPKRLIEAEALFLIGEILLIISQFTGLYYTFDENNIYHRSPAFALCYLIPLVITVLQLSTILQYRSRMSRIMSVSLLLFTIIPLAASIAQIFSYGVSLTNMTMVFMAIVVFVFAIIDVDNKAERAARMEVEFLRNEQIKIQRIFGQTAEALADAIDAKDEYTRGHSGRVSEYALKIAQRAGFSEKDCEQVYFAALLHDVGKIGVPDDIIHKPGKLTNGEFDIIKEHPVIGAHILSVITESPYLSLGAHYHHEHYDGSGYPEGLVGNEIPEIARIISVADAYDAMTSERSYRKPFPQDRVRAELVNGIGTQFDPHFAQIMIELVDEDVDFVMKDAEDY